MVCRFSVVSSSVYVEPEWMRSFLPPPLKIGTILSFPGPSKTISRIGEVRRMMSLNDSLKAITLSVQTLS